MQAESSGQTQDVSLVVAEWNIYRPMQRPSSSRIIITSNKYNPGIEHQQFIINITIQATESLTKEIWQLRNHLETMTAAQRVLKNESVSIKSPELPGARILRKTFGVERALASSRRSSGKDPTAQLWTHIQGCVRLYNNAGNGAVGYHL